MTDDNVRTMTSKFIPTVRRHYLFMLAGLLWTVAGGILCFRAIAWIGLMSERMAIVAALTGLAMAGAGYMFGFSKIVGKNVERIQRMPERANIFAFTPARGYIMIGLMMTIGITLRTSSLPKYYLAVPYAAMGGVLLTGSVRFYREFIATLAADNM